MILDFLERSNAMAFVFTLGEVASVLDLLSTVHKDGES